MVFTGYTLFCIVFSGRRSTLVTEQVNSSNCFRVCGTEYIALGCKSLLRVEFRQKV